MVAQTRRPRTKQVAAAAAAAAVSAFTPLPYQRTWVADRSRFKIGLWARQTGKSTAIALEVNADVLDSEAAGRRTTWVLLSRGERQSRELAHKVRELAALVTEARKLFQAPELVELAGNVSELRYPSGSRVIALPANPDTARGYSGHVALDEFAFHADSDAIWTALFPTITRGHKIRVVSTTNGQQNRFYQLWSEAQAGGAAWSAHRVTIHDAVAQGLPLDVDELRAGIRDDLSFRQEYECEFVDEATAWLPWDLIRPNEDPRATLVLPDGFDAVDGGAWYAGWDVARWNDLSVFWLLERFGDVLWTRAVHVMRRMRFEDQWAEIQSLVRRVPRFARLCVDATGLGEKPAEDAATRMPGRVEAVKFTAGVKESLAGDLRRALEDRRLRLPVDDAVRDDLHAVRRTVTAAGNARFAGDGPDGHADRFWACALAVHAAVAAPPADWSQAQMIQRESWAGMFR